MLVQYVFYGIVLYGYPHAVHHKHLTGMKLVLDGGLGPTVFSGRISHLSIEIT